MGSYALKKGLHFKWFEYKDSGWTAFFNTVVVFVIIVASFVEVLMLFEVSSPILIVSLIVLQDQMAIHFISRLRFNRQGYISIHESGVEVEGKLSQVFRWSDIQSLKIRVVNHSFVEMFDFIGGYFRYHHIRSSSSSESYYDKIVINDKVFYIIVNNNKEKLRFLSALDLFKNNLECCEITTVDYKPIKAKF